MAFSWERFLVQHRLPFVDTGPNINRRQLGIRCPFCGDADPSEHLALSKTGPYWGCRRNRSHSDRSPVRLVAELLHISLGAAIRIVGDDVPLLPTDADFAANIRERLSPKAKPTITELPPLRLFREFTKLENDLAGRLFFNYLTGPSRLFTPAQAIEVIEIYGLRYAINGPFGHRIIIPLYNDHAKLVQWTARSISRTSTLRYLTLSQDHFPEDSVLPYFAPIQTLLLNQQNLFEGGKTLVASEGPFDGIRLDYFGYGMGIRGTCLFGKSLSAEQEHLLITMGRGYQRRVLLLDRDATMDLLAMQSRLERGGWEFQFMKGGKDPGGLPEPQMMELLSNLLP